VRSFNSVGILVRSISSPPLYGLKMILLLSAEPLCCFFFFPFCYPLVQTFLRVGRGLEQLCSGRSFARTRCLLVFFLVFPFFSARSVSSTPVSDGLVASRGCDSTKILIPLFTTPLVSFSVFVARLAVPLLFAAACRYGLRSP